MANIQLFRDVQHLDSSLAKRLRRMLYFLSNQVQHQANALTKKAEHSAQPF